MKKIGKKLHRIFSFAMGVILVVETINCAGLTVYASEDSAGAAEAIVMDQELVEVVDAAEKADEAAYNAAQAAEVAKEAAEALADKAGDAALEVAEDGSYTEEVEGEDGTTTEEPVLKEEIDTAITDAETKVDVANTEIAEIEKDTKEDLQEIVEGAETATGDKLTAAEEAAAAAEAARKKAEEAAQKAENAGDQIAAEKAAKEAVAAAEEAQKAADTAKTAYDEAEQILKDALKAYEEAVAAAELSVEDSEVQKAAQEALDNAQAALDNAKAAVEAAKTEYDTAMADNATAQAAAEEAAKQAGIAEDAADQTIDNLEEKKDVDVEALKAEKAVKEQELQDAKDAQITINEEQDAIIADAQAKKDAADAEIANYNEAKAKIEEMEKGTGTFGWGDSQIEAAQKVANKTTSDVKSKTYIPFKGWQYTYYTQSEIDAAKATVAEYNAAKDVVKNIDIVAQKNISTTAQSDIATAEAAKAAAAQAVTDKTTEISDITTSIATIEDYIYSDKDTEVAYMDKAQQEAYQTLLSQAGVTFDAYVEIKEDTDKYIEATKDVSFKEWLGGIFTGDTWKKWFDELDLEAKYHGWKTTNGTYIIIQNDKDNTQALITIRDDKAYIATIDEAEFATYSATFDAVAASQAANKAAEAAAAEKAALDKYNAALDALAKAQARLDAAKLNKLNIEEAAKALSVAQQNVNDTKAAWEKAQDEAYKAKEAADKAQNSAEEAPAKVRYYILNRGLVQPSEDPVKSYPAANYSKSYVTGELVNGVEDENGEFTSYSSVYKKGVTGEAVYDYLKVQPTTEQINAILGEGNELKDGESITWYVIKTETDGYHVDGIISGQKFNITVRFGYTDEESGEFVDLAESKIVTVGLGESYRVDSAAIDEYVAETAYVEGVATKDDTLYVEYTKEETRTVTINYYRGSVAGTLLGTQELQVAKSKVEAYASTIRTNWLDLKKPGDCNPGELMSYVVTEDSAVANVVYTPIPVTPVGPTPEEDEPETPGTEPETTVTTVEVPTTVANATTTPAVPTTVQTQNEVTPVEPTVIEEEQTPLAPAINDDNQNGNGGSKEQEVVEIEEEEAPLAAPGHCWIHWLILLLTVVYTVYELVRCIARNKKINELQDDAEQAEA